MPDTEDQNKNAADQWAETMGTLASSWQEAMSNGSATWSENVQTAFDTATDASKGNEIKAPAEDDRTLVVVKSPLDG